jgi:hypothetical protein
MQRRACRWRNAAPAGRVPAYTAITPIGAGRRAGLKNSSDCDDRILKRRNGGNTAAGAARTDRSPARGPPPRTQSKIVIRAAGMPVRKSPPGTKGVGRKPSPDEKYLLQEDIIPVPVEIKSARPGFHVRAQLAVELNVLVENCRGQAGVRFHCSPALFRSESNGKLLDGLGACSRTAATGQEFTGTWA